MPRFVCWGTLVQRRGRWCRAHYGVVVGSDGRKVVVLDHNGNEHRVLATKLRDIDPDIYHALENGGYL